MSNSRPTIQLSEAKTCPTVTATDIRSLVKSRTQRIRGVSSLFEQVAEGKFPVNIEGINSSFIGLLVQISPKTFGSPVIVVAPTEQEAELLTSDLQLFSREPRRIRHLPWWGLLPYSNVSPLPSVFGKRASVLIDLVNNPTTIDVVVTSLRALVTPIPPSRYLSERLIELKVGANIDLTAVEHELVMLGYIHVPRVSLRGEFSVKGEVIDVYPYESDYAIRAVLDFDQIEDLRKFDPISQRSVTKMDSVSICSVHEAYVRGDTLKVLVDNIQRLSATDKDCESQIETLTRELEFPGIELLYPLCFTKPASLLEIVPEDSLLLLTAEERIDSVFEAVCREYEELYREAVKGSGFIPAPTTFLLNYRNLVGGFCRQIIIKEFSSGANKRTGSVDSNDERIGISCDPPRSFFGNIHYFREELERLISHSNDVVIFAVYEAQADRLRAIVGDLASDPHVHILPETISAGFSLPTAKIVFIQENEIFGRKRRLRRSAIKIQSEAIESFVDLAQGDYIVHVNHGVGRFHGLERMRVMGNERDYIELEFGGLERIYLPIEQVNLIQRYVGRDGRAPKLDHIGGRAWESRKAKVRKSVEELAERLVRLYAARKQIQGTAFEKDTDWQSQFEAGFPYQETEDQIRCISEVKADMEAPSPMDRLICGDVGFGKTEISLRAAFKAVMGGKQVAVLTPTTILADQHFGTFSERFSIFPVRVEMLSRFHSRSKQREIINDLGNGNVDIVIGTHRLIQKDVAFRNLGLLVIDEEQRFGVKHKEWLKETKANIDCLTLTATPIPRTLHMSLTKIRDMSIINTPPQNRMPIETFIQEYDEFLIAEVIRKELARKGQVFYLHNRVQSIQAVRKFLNDLVPEANVDFAHGQMTETDLEDVMRRFVGQQFEVLLATSIIENGLDIPNVNTIVIDRADMFGIAQLYQLRGRVGRSEKPAYAYLFYPKDRILSELSMKRLKVISDFTELGAGFKVAMKDLEVRGAGNLLGGEQSGDILAVGYDMYVRLLDQAIAKVEKDKDVSEINVEPPDVYLELQYSGYIPNSYISDPIVKMEVYKKIASVTSSAELEQIYGELCDRFGVLPDVLLSLLSIAEIRIACQRLSISSLREENGLVRIEFSRMQDISIDKVMRLLSVSKEIVSLDSAQPNCILIKTGGIGLREKSEFLSEKLGMLV